MKKNYNQIKLLFLALLLLISPALWLVVGNMPTDFNDKQSWFYLITFVILAVAVFIAFDSNKKD